MATNGKQELVYEIPKECKAGVVVDEGPNFRVEVKMVPVPQPGPDDVLVKLNATGLCYSDIHFMLGDLRGIPKMSDFGVQSTGHEGAGVIVKTGSNVKRLKVGQRAGVKPIHSVCQMCDLCWDDKECYCAEAIYTGLVTPGSYQQYVVQPERYTTIIPDDVSDYTAGPIMCSGTTMYRSIKESNLKPGQWAIFPGGGGGLGIQGVQLAHAMGMRPVVVDSGNDKKELVMKMGAVRFVDFKESSDVAADVVKICDGVGGHGVFVTAPNAYATALSLLGTRVGGVVMCIGLPPDGTAAIASDPSAYIKRNSSVKGSIVGGMADTNAALDYARRGLLKEVCQVWPFDKLPEAVEKLKNHNVAGRIVVDFNA